MSLDDPVDHGQPQPRPLARLLGGEEGLEGALAGLLLHAVAIVDDGQRGVLAGCQRREQGALRGGEGLDAEPDHQLAAVGHGVAGVDAQVHHDLVQLRALPGDVHAGLDLGEDLDPGVEDAPDQPDHLLQHLREVHAAPLRTPAPAEGQQLAREPHGLVQGHLHLLQAGLHLRPVVALQPAQVAQVDQQRREQVVEVVGHAAGNLADGLQLLRLQQLLLQPVVADEHVDRLIADLDLVAEGQGPRLHGHPVDHGAVAAIQVLQHELAALLAADARVVARDVGVQHPHLGVEVAADDHLVEDRVGPARVAPHELEQVRAGAGPPVEVANVIGDDGVEIWCVHGPLSADRV